ncbi:MAG: glycoside hydrolase family 88 protein [Clostridiales bacterium]|nr:glycoside hydrolase family 88 protein [Clostridiales bacterium]
MNDSIERYIERLLNESTPETPIWNIERVRSGQPPHWNYIDGCMLIALWELYSKSGDTKYADFCLNFMDFYIGEDGIPLGYDMEAYNVDFICPGRVLFDLYKYSRREKFKRAIDVLYTQIERQPRTYEGSFWHKAIYTNQVWLDGLFMAQVFYVRYALEYNKPEFLDDTLRQFNTAQERMYDRKTGLYRHGYDASKAAFWADKETGQSRSVWLRSLGWFSLALCDIVSYLPDGRHKDTLIKILVELLDRVGRYADPETGMYWQVVDQPGREGNYLESSGSSMIARAMLKSHRLGLVSDETRRLGLKTFKGVCDKYLSERDGSLNLGGICLLAGLGPENNRRRDGSYEYYISEPVVENDAKGVAPFLMCYVEAKLCGF